MVVRRGLALLFWIVLVAVSGGPLGCDLLKPPEAPAEPPAPEPGSCCARGGALGEASCGGSRSCCVGKLDRSTCETRGGVWFHSPEGCAGAC